MSSCGIVILAAGGSSRLGRPKQLLELQGQSLLRRCVDTALATICRPVLVVLGSQSNEIESQLIDLPVTIVYNPNWSHGIGTSIRAGIAAATRLNCDAAILLLCDQPFITAGAINHLVERHRTCGKPICAASYDGTLGTPALFAASLFGELLELPDTEGGKKIINLHAAEVDGVPLPQAAVDIDTLADYLRATSSSPAKKANPDSIQ